MPPPGDSERAHPDLEVAGPGEDLNKGACEYVCICTPVLLAASWLLIRPPPLPNPWRRPSVQPETCSRCAHEHEAAIWGGGRALVQEHSPWEWPSAAPAVSRVVKLPISLALYLFLCFSLSAVHQRLPAPGPLPIPCPERSFPSTILIILQISAQTSHLVRCPAKLTCPGQSPLLWPLLELSFLSLIPVGNYTLVHEILGQYSSSAPDSTLRLERTMHAFACSLTSRR